MEYKKIGNENKIAFEYALKDTSSGNEKKILGEVLDYG